VAEESSRTSRTNVYTPTSLAELLSLYGKLPSALLYSGGTYILHEQPHKHLILPANVINIFKIQELKRINRTERHLDIGASVPISTILSIGANVLPRALSTALSMIATPAVRNRATMGGNICIRERRMSTYPAYLLLDMQLELRKEGMTRWIPLNRFASDERKLDLERGEVLTRIRIPFATWDIELYRKIDTELENPHNFLSFCGLARVQRDVLADIRFSFGTGGTFVIRSREAENELVGRRVPISRRDSQPIFDLVDEILKDNSERLTPFQTSRVRALLTWFFGQLSGG
jgi:CO/xanthine dehydrogenase FAD-binding subunit